ncbi:MAG: hypothetical protein HC820_09620 [Hydrococcus sp. RM1_1_31]|nr:hypothetical protein [Hydrococcus sp. RM1_1_31]
MRIENRSENLKHSELLTVLNPRHENFNFDIWAVAVRDRMLAALQKGSRL